MLGLRPQAFAVFAGLLVVAATASATGSGVEFCNKDNWSCYSIKVINDASVTVKKVNVTQKNKNGCEKIAKTNKANLSLGQTFTVQANQKCEYHIKFVTTDGCTGDKDVDFPSATNEPTPKNMAELTGGCGTLKASKGYTSKLLINQL